MVFLTSRDSNFYFHKTNLVENKYEQTLEMKFFFSQVVMWPYVALVDVYN